MKMIFDGCDGRDAQTFIDILIQQMLNFKKLVHIFFAGFLSISYACFIIQLAETKAQVYLYLITYCALFFIYSLKTYATFHFPPTEPNIHTTNFDLNLIFTFKLTQERRRELELALRDGKVPKEQLIKEYIGQHKKASFCDICERVQPPRAYHCLICDACIMGKQKHSKLIGFCIGQNNEIVYLTYLMASKILYLYVFLTLTFMQFVSNQFQSLPQLFQFLFIVIVFASAMAFIIYLHQFFEVFGCVQINKTICEAKDPYLQNLSFGSSKASVSYGSLLKELIYFQKIGESSSWMTQLQEAHAEL